MTAFSYRAASASGRVQKGALEAANENDLAALLKAQGLELISAKKQSEKRGFSLPFFEKNAMSDEARALFCAQCRDLLKAGVPFADTLRHIAAAAPQAQRDRLVIIEKNILSGADAATAFGASFFDPLTTAILRAGQMHGDLAAAFARMEAHLRARALFAKTLRRAVRYPLFLLVIALCVTTFMMTLVVPQMILFLGALGTQLPVSTRVLIASAELFAALWWTTPVFIVFFVVILRVFRAKNRAFLRSSDALLTRVPVVGALVRRAALARVFSGLFTLLSAGIKLPAALREAAALAGNAAIENDFLQARERLISGEALSAALAPLISPLIKQRLVIAEESGTLVPGLEAIAATLDAQTKDAIDALLGMLEPALTLLVGALLAWIVLAVLGPVYGSLGPLAAGV